MNGSLCEENQCYTISKHKNIVIGKKNILTGAVVDYLKGFRKCRKTISF